TGARFSENRASKPCVFIGPRPVGAKHSGNNLSVKPEIFCPNASPVLFAIKSLLVELGGTLAAVDFMNDPISIEFAD
ncbi:MAG: hypothetical protein ACKO2T_12440, partial [Microcystis aeruginosa]